MVIRRVKDFSWKMNDEGGFLVRHDLQTISFYVSKCVERSDKVRALDGAKIIVSVVETLEKLLNFIHTRRAPSLHT